MITQLAQDYPLSLVCEVLNCARSSYNHHSVVAEERQVQQELERIAAEFPTYGYRRVTEQLRRQGWSINHKRVERILRELWLQAKK